MRVFACRWNGKRRYELGGARKRGSPNGSTGGSGVPDRVQEDPGLPDGAAAQHTPEAGGRVQEAVQRGGLHDPGSQAAVRERGGVPRGRARARPPDGRPEAQGKKRRR
jgi:hypothetical protein